MIPVQYAAAGIIGLGGAIYLSLHNHKEGNDIPGFGSGTAIPPPLMDAGQDSGEGFNIGAFGAPIGGAASPAPNSAPDAVGQAMGATAMMTVEEPPPYDYSNSPWPIQQISDGQGGTIPYSTDVGGDNPDNPPAVLPDGSIYEGSLPSASAPYAVQKAYETSAAKSDESISAPAPVVAAPVAKAATTVPQSGGASYGTGSVTVSAPIQKLADTANRKANE